MLSDQNRALSTDLLSNDSMEFDQAYAAEQLRRSRHPARRFVKQFYLRNICRELLAGPCIDFGCGAGQLLERLPLGSAGLEVNPHLIEFLKNNGLTVYQARGELSDFELTEFPANHFRTLVIAHVLEHLPDPIAALNILCSACRRIGIKRIVVVVPGAKGFASDYTHQTFVNRQYLKTHLTRLDGEFILSKLTYFPGPWEWIGRYFVFHEMMVVFDALPESTIY